MNRNPLNSSGFANFSASFSPFTKAKSITGTTSALSTHPEDKSELTYGSSWSFEALNKITVGFAFLFIAEAVSERAKRSALVLSLFSGQPSTTSEKDFRELLYHSLTSFKSLEDKKLFTDQEFARNLLINRILFAKELLEHDPPVDVTRLDQLTQIWEPMANQSRTGLDNAVPYDLAMPTLGVVVMVGK